MSEEGELAAAGAMNASLLGEYQGLAKELRLMRERYEELERALAEARAECQQVRDLLGPPPHGPVPPVAPGSALGDCRRQDSGPQGPRGEAEPVGPEAAPGVTYIFMADSATNL